MKTLLFLAVFLTSSLTFGANGFGVNQITEYRSGSLNIVNYNSPKDEVTFTLTLSPEVKWPVKVYVSKGPVLKYEKYELDGVKKSTISLSVKKGLTVINISTEGHKNYEDGIIKLKLSSSDIDVANELDLAFMGGEYVSSRDYYFNDNLLLLRTNL